MPRSLASTFGRPGSTSITSTPAAVPESHSAMNAATLASPDPVGISHGVTDSILTIAPSSSAACLAVAGIGGSSRRAHCIQSMCSLPRRAVGVKRIAGRRPIYLTPTSRASRSSNVSRRTPTLAVPSRQ